ncbi:MAG TPA: Flp family type IVb pilin [Caulobacteraceae bacterium]|jgi:Flp pilus assembly pilin Flp
MSGVWKSFLADERAAAGVEYGLVAAMTAVAVVGAVARLAPELVEVFADIGRKMQID